MARLLRKRPSLSIRVLEGPAPRLLEALRAGEIDLALAVGAREATAAGVSFEPLLSSPVELLVLAGERTGREVTLRTPAGSASRHAAARLGISRGISRTRSVPQACRSGLPSKWGTSRSSGGSWPRAWGVAPVPAIAFARDLRASAGLARRRLRGVPPVSLRPGASRQRAACHRGRRTIRRVAQKGQSLPVSSRTRADDSPQFGDGGYAIEGFARI